jgi:hypothetical protein
MKEEKRLDAIIKKCQGECYIRTACSMSSIV